MKENFQYGCGICRVLAVALALCAVVGTAPGQTEAGRERPRRAYTERVEWDSLDIQRADPEPDVVVEPEETPFFQKQEDLFFERHMPTDPASRAPVEAPPESSSPDIEEQPAWKRSLIEDILKANNSSVPEPDTPKMPDWPWRPEPAGGSTLKEPDDTVTETDEQSFDERYDVVRGAYSRPRQTNAAIGAGWSWMEEEERIDPELPRRRNAGASAQKEHEDEGPIIEPVQENWGRMDAMTSSREEEPWLIGRNDEEGSEPADWTPYSAIGDESGRAVGTSRISLPEPETKNPTDLSAFGIPNTGSDSAFGDVFSGRAENSGFKEAPRGTFFMEDREASSASGLMESPSVDRSRIGVRPDFDDAKYKGETGVRTLDREWR